MPNESYRPDVAVFIDFENVYVSVRDKLDATPNFESIMDRCEDLGRVVIARAYADWYRYPRITSALYANSIEPMYVPTYYYDREMGRTGRAIKNSVDMNLCVDAMKTLFTNPNIAKFVLATGDRDFIPLVNTIRQQGKEVIVIGIGGAASAHLAQSADEFIFYETLVGKPASTLAKDQPKARTERREQSDDEPEREPRQRDRETPVERDPTNDVYDTLVQAIHLARERGYVCSFGSLKLLMKELMNGEFKEGKYKDASGRPFAKFKDFVLEAERRGKVQVFTNGTVNEVFLPGEDPYKLSQFVAEIKEARQAEVAPVLPVAVEERPVELRATITGRRRRRRPRNQRPLPVGEEMPQEQGDDEIGYEEPDLNLAPDFDSPEEVDAIFNTLLDAVEQEDAEREARHDLELEDVGNTDTLDEPVEAVAVVSAPIDEILEPDNAPIEMMVVDVPVHSPAPPVFHAHEWELIREVLMRSERPLSFAQIHDALRSARNQATLGRTNEELRTLIKQAINSGMLERTGKGARIAYHLRTAEEGEQLDLSTSEGASEPVALEATGMSEQAADDGAESVAAVAEPVVEEAAKPKRRGRRKKTTTSEVAEPVSDTTLFEQTLQAAQELAQTPEVEPVAEEAAKPKRRSRRKKAALPESPEES